MLRFSRPLAHSSRFLPFEEARSFARRLGFTSWNEWDAWRRTDARPWNIPYEPLKAYGGCGWAGRPDWLGCAHKVRPGQTHLPRAGFPKGGTGAVNRGLETRKSFVKAVRSLLPDVDFVTLRLGQQASLLFRLTGNNIEEEREKKWIALQIKTGTPCIADTNYCQVSLLSSVDDVRILVMAPQKKVLAVSPEDRKNASRILRFSVSRCVPAHDIGEILRSWWNETPRATHYTKGMESERISDHRFLSQANLHSTSSCV